MSDAASHDYSVSASKGGVESLSPSSEISNSETRSSETRSSETRSSETPVSETRSSEIRTSDAASSSVEHAPSQSQVEDTRADGAKVTIVDPSDDTRLSSALSELTGSDAPAVTLPKGVTLISTPAISNGEVTSITLSCAPERSRSGDNTSSGGSSAENGSHEGHGREGSGREGGVKRNGSGGGGGGSRGRNPDGERKFTGRCSPERLSGETSRQERRELSSALALTIEQRLRSGKAVYLDGLGVLFPEQIDTQRPYVLGTRLAVRKETVVRPGFERAGEFSPFIREKYSPLEMADLLEAIYAALPISLQLTWTPPQVRFYLSGIVALLKREIVQDGFSHRLTPLASFFALHNRHGPSDVDWFAGSDIFVRSTIEQVVKVAQPRLLERAKFRDAEEFGSTVLGTCKHRFPLNMLQAIRELGLTPSRAFYPDVEILIFERAPGRLAFMTVGARNIPRADGGTLGVEFLLDAELDGLATWPFTLLAAAIDRVCFDGLLFSSPGSHTAVEVPPIAFGAVSGSTRDEEFSSSSPSASRGQPSPQHAAQKWSGVLLTQAQVQDRMLLEDGNDVGLLWVTPLRAEEFAVAERRTAEHLASILSRKGALLSAKLHRTSVLFRTQIL